jgi:lipopolysaccharide biosynthesis regulator YciM
MHEQVWQYLADPANQRFILYLLAAIVVGFLAGRYLRRGISNGMPFFDKGDSAFFKGIQYLLSDDPDHAIEEFTKSVQINSDTIETYAALGNLYRSKGAIDRAIHIRRSIILRPNIDEETKVRALFDLGLDYKRGGFLDRALETFLNVIKKRPSDIATLEELEKIYEEIKDWETPLRRARRSQSLQKQIAAAYWPITGQRQERYFLSRVKQPGQRHLSKKRLP